MQKVFNHAKHIFLLGGADVLCLGSDFDGCDHLPAGITGVDGWAKIYTALSERGYSKRLLDDIFYNNLMRVVRNICDM